MQDLRVAIMRVTCMTIALPAFGELSIENMSLKQVIAGLLRCTGDTPMRLLKAADIKSVQKMARKSKRIKMF